MCGHRQCSLIGAPTPFGEAVRSSVVLAFWPTDISTSHSSLMNTLVSGLAWLIFLPFYHTDAGWHSCGIRSTQKQALPARWSLHCPHHHHQQHLSVNIHIILPTGSLAVPVAFWASALAGNLNLSWPYCCVHHRNPPTDYCSPLL